MDDLREQLNKLERAVTDLDKACKQALGFYGTIEYEGISFNVSKRYVIADLSPLSYFEMVEYIHEEPGGGAAEGAEGAVVRLYERLLPLLSCVHQWTPLGRAEDELVRLVTGEAEGGPRPHICKACTGYALEGSLPVVGRELARKE